jgi:hypothetical protein
MTDPLAGQATINAEVAQQEFDRDKVCYEQNYQQFRSLNQSMWQVPIIAMTLNGGLWFAAATLHSLDLFKGPLFFLAAVFNVSLIFVLVRVRYVMEEYLKALKRFHPDGFVSAPGDRWYNGSRTVMRAFSTALALSATCSLLASIYFAARVWWSC